nr:hypothetical protein [uncultured Roseococcus sp.]
MKLRKLGADAGAFAHLFGRRKAEEDKKPAAEAAPEDPDAEDPEGDPEEEEEGPDAENPGEEREAEEERDEEAAEARGAARERARCRAIFASPDAASNVALAAHLAFDTDQTAAQAVATLKLSGKSASGLGARMAAAPNPSLGAGEPRQTSKRGALSAGWDAAFKRAGIATTGQA